MDTMRSGARRSSAPSRLSGPAWSFDPLVIRSERRRRRMTRGQFAGLFEPKVSLAQINRLERWRAGKRMGSRGRCGITLTTLLRICNQLGLSPADVFKRVA